MPLVPVTLGEHHHGVLLDQLVHQLFRRRTSASHAADLLTLRGDALQNANSTARRELGNGKASSCDTKGTGHCKPCNKVGQARGRPRPTEQSTKRDSLFFSLSRWFDGLVRWLAGGEGGKGRGKKEQKTINRVCVSHDQPPAQK